MPELLQAILRRGKTGSSLPYVVVALLAVAIFIFDTLTTLEIAAASLYVTVVLLAARFAERRTLLVISVSCIALTLTSFVLTPAGVKEAGLINTLISLAVIGLSTFLVIEAESAKSKARTLARTELLRDAVIGSMSHELKTPLTSILGAVSVLTETKPVKADADVSKLISAIGSEAARLDGDIQNLLDAARIAGHDLQSRIDWTDPADVIGAAVTRARVRHPGRRIVAEQAEGLPLIRVDPVLVEQAIYQIVANALKFSPTASPVQVGSRFENDRLSIIVRDEGFGLTEDERERVTERFYRGERHVGRIPGSGLGMWIANTFVTASGGALDIASDGEGKGTTVRIVFPIPQDEPAAKEPGRGASDGRPA